MTQALDAAVRAGCDATGCNYPECQTNHTMNGIVCRSHARQSIKTLRAAHPAEPPSALMSAIHMAIENETGIQINTPISQIIWRMIRAHILGEDA